MTASARVRLRRLVRCLPVAIALSGVARADVWTAEPSVSAGGEYSTNPLSIPEGTAGQAAVMNAALPLTWADGVHHLDLEPKVRFAAAGGASGLGADGYYLSGGYRAEWARLQLGAHVGVSDDSTVIQQPDAGTLIRDPVRQHGVTTALSEAYDLTERDSLSTSVDLRNQRYGVRTFNGLYDFKFDSFSLRYTRLLSEEVALFVSVEAVNYVLPDYDYRTDSKSVSVGATGVVAEKWQYRLSLSQSRLSTSSNDTHPQGNLYAVNLNRAGERLNLTLSLVKSLQPSGFGTLVVSQEATVRADWQANERLSLHLSNRQARTRDAFSVITLSNRNYDVVTAGTEWALSERWSTHADLTYTTNTNSPLFSTAWTAHAVGISIGLTRRFSRLTLT